MNTPAEAPGQPGGSDPTVPGRQVAGYCLAIMSIAAAVIHFAVAGSHYQQYWLYGVFMLGAAWLQLAWAVAMVTRPARWVFWGGAAVNTGVIAVYIVTRTVGDLVGPTAHTAEPVGFGDVLCTVLEAGVVVGCSWLLATRGRRRVRHQTLVTAPAVTGAATAVLVSVALVAGGPEMLMSAAASPSTPARASAPMNMSRSGTAGTTAIRLTTATPGGNITMPDPNMQMAPGMQMASPAMCDTAPTGAQRRAAVRLVKASWQSARRYRSLAAAEAAGYVPITPSGLPVVHYLNYKSYFATLRGGPVLDIARPQSLVYANTPHGAVLAAAMYIAPSGRATPQPGGCLTQWHIHTNLCQTAFGQVVGVITAAHPSCPAGSSNHVSPPMMHVWYVPIPGGPTAIDATDAQIVRASERVGGPRNGPA